VQRQRRESEDSDKQAHDQSAYRQFHDEKGYNLLPDGPLKLPTVEDQRTQQALDAIAAVFPLKAQNLGKNSVGSEEIAAGAVGVEELAAAAKELFLQLVTAGSRKVAVGAAEVEWPGAKIESNIVEVTHGIGSVPFIVYGINFKEAAGVVTPQTIEKTATKFKVRAFSSGTPGAGVKAAIDWIAIG
jgi:hypothetical protein